VAERKEFLEKDAKIKIQKLSKNNDALKKMLRDRVEESVTLEEKIRSLRGEVAARKSVRQSRDDARGGVGDPAAVAMAKMKKVVQKRHLIDTARTQGEEIDLLRQELDRLRQKTFPSFSRKKDGH